MGVLAVLLLIFAAAAAFGWRQGARGRGPAPPDGEAWPGVAMPALASSPQRLEEGPFNLLVLGSGGGSREGGAAGPALESVAVVHVDEGLKRVALLSVPVSTYVDLLGRGKHTLGEVYGLGGAELTRQVVEDVVGLPFRGHLELGQEGLAGLVEMLGGVEFNLEEDVADPRWGRLEAGPVLLDGIGVLLVTRSPRYPGGELQRIRAAQALAIAAANRFHGSASLPGAAWLLNLGLERVRTDLGTGEAVRLAREFGSWPVADLSAGTAPGTGGRIGAKAVYLLDREKMEEAVRSVNASATVPSH